MKLTDKDFKCSEYQAIRLANDPDRRNTRLSIIETQQFNCKGAKYWVDRANGCWFKTKSMFQLLKKYFTQHQKRGFLFRDRLKTEPILSADNIFKYNFQPLPWHVKWKETPHWIIIRISSQTAIYKQAV